MSALGSTLTAILTPAVGERAAADDAGADTERYIPLHTLKGDAKKWADGLLAVFKGQQIDSVEWSLKFSLNGLVGNRFLLGILRENWHRIDFSALPQTLAIPPALWAQIVRDMEQARSVLFAYEPNDGPGTYRIYVEFVPAPEALREHGVLPLGCGYKWDPKTGLEDAITVYRTRFLENRAAFERYLNPYFARLENPVVRRVAHEVIAAASREADPSGFMFLEVDEARSRRDSFTVTFRGTRLPLLTFIPDLLQLADSLALSKSEVLTHFVSDEPRSIYSLAAGTARDGHEFLTVYYD